MKIVVIGGTGRIGSKVVARLRGAGHDVLAAAPNTASAQPKISKVAVNYQDHPDGDKRCDRCAQFQPPDACKVVDGPVSPQGSCRIFILGHT